MSSSATSTYRQYKHGTEAMLNWLSKALGEHGINFGRKLEDASIRTLLDLASQAQQKGASMPLEVLYALEDALKIRRQYHAWFTNQLWSNTLDEDNKHTRQSNEAHAAFIDVLQGIHDLFVPAKSLINQQPSSSSSDKKILEISNSFTKLKAEDVATEESHTPISKPAPHEQAPKPWMVRKSQMLVEDKLLELYCLYNDASNIRGYVRNKWAEYASRRLDIVSAAMITQEALELFSEAEKSFESKYGTIPKNDPSGPHLKHWDIVYYLAIGEPRTSTYTSDELASMLSSDIEIAKLEAQCQTADRQMRFAESGWLPSEELNHWLMQSAVCMLEKMLAKVDEDWVLRQACLTPDDRVDALNAVGFDEGLDDLPGDTAQELLNTFIDVYAGMIFIKQNQNPGSLATPPDIITSQWLGKYNLSIRMALSMQILHDIRTAKSDSGKIDILTQVSEDYKRLGVDMATHSQYFEAQRRTLRSKNQKLLRKAATEESWLAGRAPGKVQQPSNMTKAESRKLSELPLAMNPVHAGMLLFHLLFRDYAHHVLRANSSWHLIPFAHLLNWTAVKARDAKADFQDLFRDVNTAIGLLGPKLVWLGASPPDNLNACRNRILLAWGLQLTDFYKRIISGDIPTAEELFKKIKNNTNAGYTMTDEEVKSLLDGKDPSRELVDKLKRKKPSQLLEVETSQSTPLLHAVHENLRSSLLMNAQQKHIRKIFLGSGSKPKTSDELDMLSYLDAFSRTARAEIPRLIFSYNGVSQQCSDISTQIFICTKDIFVLPSEITKMLKRAGLDDRRNLRLTTKGDELGSGAQCVSSLLALATIFANRADSLPTELFVLDYIENAWDNAPSVLPRHHFTKQFVDKCKEFGFAIPECATAALP